jgi:1-acyl-sn-glycerol-3-phosphate acyltransferase
MRRLFTVLYWLFVATTCVVNFGVAVVLWILTAPFDPQRRLNHYWSCAWAAPYAWIYPGWRIRVAGRRRIDRGRAYVLVANHTSIADIVLCFLLFRQFKWVSKTSVFRAPFLGWNMWLCRYVPLVRGDAESIQRMLAACRRWLDRGMSIMMFPEGTRSKDGQVKPFKHGAFTLALEAGVPVVPIAIHGGHALIPKHGQTFATRADLLVEVLDPVSPDGHDAASLAAAVRERICAALGQTN